MGKIRRGGFLFLWWLGDHAPRHIHVFDGKGEKLGRVAIHTGEPLDNWRPTRKVLQIINELKNEGRL